MNIVFIKHMPNAQRYLFEVPAGIQLQPGDHVRVETRNGQTDGICETDSFELEGPALDVVVQLAHASMPLKPVIGKCVCVPFEPAPEPENQERALMLECAGRHFVASYESFRTGAPVDFPQICGNCRRAASGECDLNWLKVADPLFRVAEFFPNIFGLTQWTEDRLGSGFQGD